MSNADGQRALAIADLVESAEAMGIELDREGAERWIAAMSAESYGVVVDVAIGAYGHRVTLANHDAVEFERFRRLAAIVGFEDQPPTLTTALPMSGSAAQSPIHGFPADADFFQQVHIRAGTRAAACQVLAEAIRQKALATLRGNGYRLQDVKFGSWPAEVTVEGQPIKRGQPVSWRPTQVEQGSIGYRGPEGRRGELTWQEAAGEPGLCKLGWVIADPIEGGLGNVSNVLDPTWEAPDGTITPLDSFESIPLLSRLATAMGAESVAEYVERLTEEVYQYTVREPNFGKAARRMYNIFRLTGRNLEAAYIRQLFDEPVTALYQISALLRALGEAADSGDALGSDALVGQIDQLIMSAIAALEGRAEADMVRRLLRLRDAVSASKQTIERADDIAGVRDDALRAVNEYFERALRSMPTIAGYLETVAEPWTAAGRR